MGQSQTMIKPEQCEERRVGKNKIWYRTKKRWELAWCYKNGIWIPVKLIPHIRRKPPIKLN